MSAGFSSASLLKSLTPVLPVLAGFFAGVDIAIEDEWMATKRLWEGKFALSGGMLREGESEGRGEFHFRYVWHHSKLPRFLCDRLLLSVTGCCSMGLPISKSENICGIFEYCSLHLGIMLLWKY